MEKDDVIEVAKLAALVGGELNLIDTKMIAKSSTSTNASARITPQKFLDTLKPKQQNKKPLPNMFKNSMITQFKNSMITQPKSTVQDPIVVGVEDVNIKDLLIPIDTSDRELCNAIKNYTSKDTKTPPLVNPPTTSSVPNVPSIQTPINENKIITSDVNTNLIITLLKEINQKLDLILKHAKIKAKYKKG